ncbi:MAG: hypothetical protein OXK79_08015 [Chloroflexota bacterium]|nr:hypothetical protein [Chloroflexota bacterium]
MARFPLIQSLSVDNYALYPGPQPDQAGLATSFHPGLTLVLGANGLGKTTLVWLLYRMLCGPYDISGLDRGGRLGTRRLEARRLRKAERLFAQRVVDGAKDGLARLQFDLGSRRITVTRRLSNLTLIAFCVDETELDADEEVYQSSIASLAGVWSFGDWILLLRYLTFYFEDRRALVWDPTAQTQLLRLLFLPPETAQVWTERERRILELDSQARNLGAALTREEVSLSQEEELELTAPEVQAELSTLADLQESDEGRRDELDENAHALDSLRKSARLTLLAAEHEREAAARALEHAKLTTLQERFPTAGETARYILAQLFVEGECLACGSEVPEVAESLESRVDRSRCVVCDSPIAERKAQKPGTESLSKRRVSRAVEALERTSGSLAGARTRLDDAAAAYTECRQQLEEVDAALASRRERMDTLIRRLPEEAQALRVRREELAVLRGRVVAMKEELTGQRESFTRFIDEVKERIVDHAPTISRTFVAYAREFLFEDCDLRWSPVAQRVGQTGPAIDFPVFELDLASASYRSPVRRSGPDEVSESQREFIDLAFRMTLMEVADPGSGATLIIDAPESSLDAVFVRRAAEVLARFGDPAKNNRLAVTSNLTDGDLIPKLFELCHLQAEAERVVDLFEVAEPTAAVREHSEEYRKVKEVLWTHSRGEEID